MMLLIYFKISSLSVGQLYNCPSDSDPVSNMILQKSRENYYNLTKHKKTKQSATMRTLVEL